MLDLIGSCLLTAIVVVNLFAFIGALDVGRQIRLSIAAMAGLWLGLQAALAAEGAFAGEFSRLVPLVGIMVALPPLVVAAVALVSPAARHLLLALPTPLLIGLNTGRLLGLFFLLLAGAGRLGGPFPFFAGWGDIVVGAVALPLSLAVAKGAAGLRSVTAWNLFGVLDLVLAVTLGTLSSNGFAFQAIEAGPGSQAVQQMPWLLIPTVLVPFYLIVHGIVFAQIRHNGEALATLSGPAFRAPGKGRPADSKDPQA